MKPEDGAEILRKIFPKPHPTQNKDSGKPKLKEPEVNSDYGNKKPKMSYDAMKRYGGILNEYSNERSQYEKSMHHMIPTTDILEMSNSKW